MPTPAPPSHSQASERPCDIFFHLPKTGGQTLINLVNRHYRNRVIDTDCGFLTPARWQRFCDRLRTEASADRPPYAAVTGHMKFGLHELLPYPSRYVTMLREPVARFASLFHMLQRMDVVSCSSPFDLLNAECDSPQHEFFRRELDNGQTRALADAPWDLPYGECGEEHLRTAEANLEKHFAFVGLTEQFDLSMMLLGRVSGWRWRFYVPRNQAPPLPPELALSCEVRGRMADLNQFDRRLFNFARERFAESAGRLGIRLERTAFRVCSLVHGGLHHASRSVKKKLRASKPQCVEGSVPHANKPV